MLRNATARVAAPSIRSALLASCWPRPQQRLPVSATGGGRRCCSYRGEALAFRKALSLRQRLPSLGELSSECEAERLTPILNLLYQNLSPISTGFPPFSPLRPQKSDKERAECGNFAKNFSFSFLPDIIEVVFEPPAKYRSTNRREFF